MLVIVYIFHCLIYIVIFSTTIFLLTFVKYFRKKITRCFIKLFIFLFRNWCTSLYFFYFFKIYHWIFKNVSAFITMLFFLLLQFLPSGIKFKRLRRRPSFTLLFLFAEVHSEVQMLLKFPIQLFALHRLIPWPLLYKSVELFYVQKKKSRSDMELCKRNWIKCFQQAFNIFFYDTM